MICFVLDISSMFLSFESSLKWTNDIASDDSRYVFHFNNIAHKFLRKHHLPIVANNGYGYTNVLSDGFATYSTRSTLFLKEK